MGRASRERATLEIGQRIITGELAAGARLDEDALARELAEDPVIVRDALCFLRRDGFVRDAEDGGFAVTELDEVELREAYPIAILLEGLAVRTAPAYPPELLAELRAHNADMEREGCDPAAAATHDFRFHDALAAACGNEQLLATLRPLKRMLLRYELAYMRDPGVVDDSVRRHGEIVDALERGDRERAAACVEANFRDAMPALLERIAPA
jgi:DNA-binding GntR family transcriptional regulator